MRDSQLAFVRVYAASASSGGKKRKLTEEGGEPLRLSTIVRLGVEIETCLKPGRRISENNMFEGEDDDSIRCEDGLRPREFVSRSPVHYYCYANRSTEIHPQPRESNYHNMLNDMKEVFAKSDPCLNETCGTHVHMSVPVTVNAHPFLFVILQKSGSIRIKE